MAQGEVTVPESGERLFGRLPDGRPVHRHVLRAAGVELHVLELGATVHQLHVAGRDGVRRNVVLGHATVADHLSSTSYFGATIGRYANRIAGGRFVLDGQEVSVPANDRGNNLHGGPDGFDRQLWRTESASQRHCLLTHESPAGHQGFPGTVRASVRYQVSDGEVHIEHRATTDSPTVVSMTNHSYFNLDGEAGAPGIDRHLLRIEADHYTPTDASSIPLGAHARVDGTPFDWRQPRVIGPEIRRDHEQLTGTRGIDHNVVLRPPDPGGDRLRDVAVLASPESGLATVIGTDQPGLQVYTGNFLDGSVPGTSGSRYRQGAGIALEPQAFPDSPNHPEYPSTVLRPGEEYRSRIVWRFVAWPDPQRPDGSWTTIPRGVRMRDSHVSGEEPQ